MTEIVIFFLVLCVAAIAVWHANRIPSDLSHNYNHSLSSPPVKRHARLEESDTMIPKYFVFDIETTGLPRSRKASDVSLMPRVVSVGWYVLDERFGVVKSEYYILKPYKYLFPQRSVDVHGITREQAVREGAPHNVVYSKFIEDLQGCDTVVCHNAEFDVPILEADLIRWWFPRAIIGVKQVVCTMKNTTAYCALPKRGGRGYKYPKLEELYDMMYRNEPLNGELHNAGFDAYITSLCMKAIDVRSLPLKPEKLYY